MDSLHSVNGLQLSFISFLCSTHPGAGLWTVLLTNLTVSNLAHDHTDCSCTLHTAAPERQCSLADMAKISSGRHIPCTDLLHLQRYTCL